MYIKLATIQYLNYHAHFQTLATVFPAFNYKPSILRNPHSKCKTQIKLHICEVQAEVSPVAHAAARRNISLRLGSLINIKGQVMSNILRPLG